MLKFKYLLLILIFTISCKIDKKTTKDKGVDLEIDSKNKLSLISKVDTIFDTNAPKRITRNVKLDSDGNILIAAYDDIIRYNGYSFTRLSKPQDLERWYAFDVIEDSKKNIWIASDQLGAFRIDSKKDSVTNFTTKDGLGHLRNMCVYEHRDGNMWNGGQGGLSKYDGSKFTNFTIKDGLPHNNINIIFEDHQGNIWFGTRGNAGIYDGNDFSELRNGEDNPFFNVWSIVEDKSNNILLVDSTGLWKYSNDSFEFKLKDVWKIYQDSKSNYWYTGMLKGGGSTLKQIEEKAIYNKEFEVTEVFKSDRMFFGVIEDKNSNLWIGGGDGIWLYNGEIVKYYTGTKK